MLEEAFWRRLPAEQLELLREVGRRADRAGLPSFLVGGVVRDLLLGVEIRDIDVVVEGDALAMARALGADRGARVRVHEAFGTAAVALAGGLRLDFATARTEHYASPGALPRVASGDIRQDLFRRDFTINALAVHLDPARFGSVLDLFGGIRDLGQRKIRVLHDRSFLEDPTRAFRAVRFAVRLSFEIAPETARLIAPARGQGSFAKLSAARIRRELELLLGGCDPARAVRMLALHRLLESVHPEIAPSRKTYARLERAADALAWHRRRLGKPAPREWTVTAGALLEPLAPAVREEVVARLKPSRQASSTLREGPALALEVARALRGHRDLPASLIHGICHGRTTEVLLLAMSFARHEGVRERVARFLTEIRDVRSDLRGQDLLVAGVPPGPAVARGLAAALAAKLDGSAPGRDQQLVVALSSAGKHRPA